MDSDRKDTFRTGIVTRDSYTELFCPLVSFSLVGESDTRGCFYVEISDIR